MDDQSSLSRSHFAWLRGLAKLCRRLVRGAGAGGCRRLAAAIVDARLRRDIGLDSDGNRGVGEVRQAHYRKLLEHGQPLP